MKLIKSQIYYILLGCIRVGFSRVKYRWNYGIFWQRKREKRLSKMIFDERQNLCLVYGRRRIGKSELIKQVLKESAILIKSIYYECKQTSEKNNVESFSEIVCENLGLPKLMFSDFEEILKFHYFIKISLMKIKSDFILFLAEFPIIIDLLIQKNL